MARKYQVIKMQDEMNWKITTRILIDYPDSIRVIDVVGFNEGARNGWNGRYIGYRKVGDVFVGKHYANQIANFTRALAETF